MIRSSDPPSADVDYVRPHMQALLRAMLVSVLACSALAGGSWLLSRCHTPTERGFFVRAIMASACAWALALPLLFRLLRGPVRQQRRARTLLGRVAAGRALLACARLNAGVVVAVHAAVFTGAAFADWGSRHAALLLLFGAAMAGPSALATWTLGQRATLASLHMRAPLAGEHAPDLRTRLPLELAVWAALALWPILPAAAIGLSLTEVPFTPRLLLLGLVVPAAAALFHRYGLALERDIEVARVRVVHLQSRGSALAAQDAGGPEVETREGQRIVQAIATLVSTHQRLFGEELNARASITESQRLKTRFMAYMSHDLRSPLNAILGFTDLLVTGSDPLNAEQRESLDTVRHAADDLLRLVSEVLDTARLEAGKLKLVSGYVPVATLLSGVVGRARRTAQTLGIELDTLVEPGVPAVFVDAARMQQALLGLVLHLAHTSAPGSPIALRASRAKGPPGPEAQVRIFVDAPGMTPPSNPDLLFEAFRFGRRESGMHAGGLGLGLSLARSLVEAQGGAIWFEAPGTVCVALPREGH